MDTMVSISSLHPRCTDMISILHSIGSKGNSAICKKHVSRHSVRNLEFSQCKTKQGHFLYINFTEVCLTQNYLTQHEANYLSVFTITRISQLLTKKPQDSDSKRKPVMLSKACHDCSHVTPEHWQPRQREKEILFCLPCAQVE